MRTTISLQCAIAVVAMTATASLAHAADLVIAMPNWSSGQATANILKAGIESKFGLDTEVREMGTLNAFAGLGSGTVDIHPEVWRPNLDNLIEQYGGDNGPVALSPKTVTAWQGLCTTRETVERYKLSDVSDLMDTEKTASLDTDGDGRGELWIGALNWSSTPIERIRANSYGYAKNLTLTETPEDVGMAAVDTAVATGRPIVFACYAPHHVFELHDIVRLTEPAYDPAKWQVLLPTEDPLWMEKSRAPVAWDTAHFQIAYAKSLRERHPQIAAFLDRIDFTTEEITGMSYALQVERQDPAEYARKWVADHGDRVDGWAKP
ncbi:MAG: glycine betaine ABC transporter substrate-binding protein [Phyllobacterium sp.]